MDHLFRECPVLEEVWRELSYHQCLHDIQMEFSQWLTWVFSHSSTSQCRIFCCALWAIWGDRNARTKSPRNCQEMEKATNRMININFDAAYDGRQKRSTVGIVVRDSEGSVLLLCSEIHHRITSVFTAEAVACRKAIQTGIGMKWASIIIEGDSLSIIRKCKKKNPDESWEFTWSERSLKQRKLKRHVKGRENPIEQKGEEAEGGESEKVETTLIKVCHWKNGKRLEEEKEDLK
ncbi:hypothetical protein Gohar_025684 [Gossypium harknessii]|uniref:RNase H type-1 domain-containing protein n=1 Tax=Gossypium harknessii TaxID=34285 RepID=A0A7J9I693_9ROSI|nr:hypothetical protein [Gossypium harknessii]